MERIKLAIEKAKSGDLAAVPARDPAANTTPLQEPVADEVRQVQTPSPDSIQYRQTEVVPLDDAHLERHRVIAHQKTHPASWSFDVLRTQVLQQMDEKGWRTLAITSPTVESGKTLVSINLAMSIAQQTNRTALLVDFDLRRPKVASNLGLRRKTSLNEVLEGGVDVAKAMVNPGLERLVVLPTDRPVPKAAELLASAKVSELIAELRDRYGDRIVILDLPPILVADDVMAVLPHVDCVLLVVGSGASSEKEIEEAMTRLSKAQLLGVVLNKDDAPARSSYYY